jgi:hypothetical protein
MKRIGTIGITLLWLAGCAPVEKMTEPAKPAAAAKPVPVSNAAPAQPTTEPSVARQAINGFTGKTAVDNFQRTKDRIKAIDAQNKKNYEEIPQ